MPVYPLKFALGPLELTGFGFMMVAGFFLAGWVMERELRRRHLAPDYSWSIVFAGLIGGIVGAKIWYAVLHQNPGALFSRSGLVWYGGFIGGAAAVILNSWRLRVPLRFTADLAALALPVGYAVGRVGCFLVQDDYGGPTTLPWGMRFPDGLPPSTAANLAAYGVAVPPGTPPTEVLAVHPTQLYEAVAMLVVFWFLWRLRRRELPSGRIFALYLMLAGTERFLVEFLRAKDDRFVGTFTVAQLVSFGVVATGAVLVSAWRTGVVQPGLPPSEASQAAGPVGGRKASGSR